VENTLKKRCFIVFEGIDGSGKSTQAAMLAQRLTKLGIPILLTCEPSHGPVGRIIRSLTTRPEPEEEERLFTEDRRDHVNRTILPAMKEGKTVICDRYIHSSAAYQGARGLDPIVLIRSSMSFAPKPDIVFLLEIPIDLAMARIGSVRAEGFSLFEATENLRLVDGIYRGLTDPCITRIDGTRDPDEIHRVIWDMVNGMHCVGDKNRF